jgi:Polyketide cyclase / dehydrase and lipid transport
MRIARDLEMDVPADRVWQVLANDFAKIGEWYSGVHRSQVKLDPEAPEGAACAGRISRVPGLGEIHETFTSYDPSNKTFAYEVTGMPFFVKGASNSFAVATIDGGRSRVSLEAITHFAPVVGWLMVLPMKLQLSKLMGQLLEELKHYVEKGEIHPRKAESIAKR